MKQSIIVQRFGYILIPLILVVAQSCDRSRINEHKALFEKNTFSETGIDFSNDLVESDTFNYFSFPYIYLGGGVAIGDLNNDGLSDIYFTGNMVSNKLYLNQGNLQFKDITLDSGTGGDDRWYTGVTMVDINNDGHLDIYLSVSGKDKETSNQLFVNNGDLTFTEKASQYGIADSGTSMQSTFFDYDNDGLQDLFVANYPVIRLGLGNTFYHDKMVQNTHSESGHLYRNMGDGHFVDVTKEAGVQNYGLTLGVVASDLNNDGWKDLYLSNDFNVPDYLYINNQDGTFTEKIKETTGHTSFFGMGVDAADFNNDGWIDLVQSEMNPEDYKRSKKNMSSMDPVSFQERRDLGFHYQYMQNSLQLNNGIKSGVPMFSEISRYAGIAATDWSWSSLFMDFDNNGLKDIYISNGMKRDVNDNDVKMNSLQRAGFNKDVIIDISEYPSVPLNNYAYTNVEGIDFVNTTEKLGLTYKGFTHGVAYGDLNNDGTLDLVLNNLDDNALIFKNNAPNTNYVRFKLNGPKNNVQGLGSLIELYSNGKTQVQELTLTRGYLSSMEPILHFGLNHAEKIDSVKIIWPNRKVETLHDLSVNKLIQVDYSVATETLKTTKPKEKFKEVTHAAAISFKHTENHFDDYKEEPLLPHRNSRYGPALAVGDINTDGLDDFYIGNAAGSPSALYTQTAKGTFEELQGVWKKDMQYEDTGALFADFNNDGKIDLYVVSGGNDPDADFQDRLYLNTDEGFIKADYALPAIENSGLTVSSCDYDQDGDMDLFIGGRIVPGKYPLPATSLLLRNNLETGKFSFTDVTKDVFPQLLEMGLVTAALWHDFTGDGVPDLLATGEWMPIRLFENKIRTFQEITNQVGLDGTEGWWYDLEISDIDLDGDMDIVGGNLGLNYKYKATQNEPFEIYAHDFDVNGKLDIVLSYNKKGLKLPVRGRECSSQQVPAIARRFKTFSDFADADLEEIYGEAMLKKSINYSVENFGHFWFENIDDSSFIRHELPKKAQLSAITSIVSFNYNDDDYPDLLIAGNLYNSEVETPRNDSGIGLILQNTGNKDFMVLSPGESGLMLRNDVRNVRRLSPKDDFSERFLFGINNDSLKLIEFKKETNKISRND